MWWDKIAFHVSQIPRKIKTGIKTGTNLNLNQKNK